MFKKQKCVIGRELIISLGDRVCVRVESNVLLMEGIVLRRVVFLDYIVSVN